MEQIEQRMGIVQTKNRGRAMKKKKLMKLEASIIACAVILSVLSGCIGQAEEELVEEAPGVTDPDTLNILAYGEPDQLDPATCYDARGSLVIQNLYDRLVGYDSPDTAVINPRLAERWEISSDGMEYTFYLRKDATFHDGSPVNAAAVKYSFDRVLKMNQPPAWMMAQCMDLNSTQVIDDYTVKITLTKPYAAFLPILCYTVASVVNPAVIDANGGVVENEENVWVNQNETGAGSGPYELMEWIPNERIVLKSYEDYWRGAAKLPNVILKFIPEIGTRVMLLKKGDADIATGFPETNIPDILGAEGVTVFADPSYDVTFIVLGCRGALADVNVRQAVCMAVDYDTILSFVYHGYAKRLNSVIPAGMFGWHDVEPYQYDVDGANALLDQAGYTMDEATGYRIDPATGEALGAEIAVPQGDELRSQISLLWQNSLSKIGFKLEIREITWAMMYKLIRNEETDMIISGWLPDYADPDNYTDSMCGSANAKAIWGSDYKNEELDSLIDQAKWEPDTEKRKKLYYKILLIIKDDAPFVWMAQTAHVEAHRTWVQGYFYNPCQSMEFWRIYKGRDELKEAAQILSNEISIPQTSEVFFVGPVSPGTVLQENRPIDDQEPVKLEVPDIPGTYYAFYIDDMPGFMFVHRVRYAWVNVETEKCKVVSALWSPLILEPEVTPTPFRLIKSYRILGVSFWSGKGGGTGDVNNIVNKPNAKPPQTQTEFDALVIDAGDTDKSSLRGDAADNSNDQANSIEKYLSKNGFRVQRISQYWGNKLPTIRYDPNKIGDMKDQLKKIIEGFIDNPYSPSEFFLYINAHGNQDGFALYDPTGSGKSEFIWYKDLYDWLKEFPAYVNIVIFIDSCESGGALKELKRLNYDQRINDQRIGLTIMTATDSESFASSGEVVADSATEDFLEGSDQDLDGDGKTGDLGDCWISMKDEGVIRLGLTLYSYNPQIYRHGRKSKLD